MLMAQLEQKQGEGEGWWSDGWDGYPAGRQRLLAHVAEHKIDNVVVIGGDIHSFWVSDLKRDSRDPASPTVATEFVGTSVTSEGVPFDRFNAFVPENPHIRSFESRARGYVLAEVRPDLWRTDLRVVDTVTRPKATAQTLESFVVETGKAGAHTT
jgi:alkaline phosphatase D